MVRIILTAFLLAFGMSVALIGQINLNFSSGINYSNCVFKEIQMVPRQGRLGYFIGIAPSYTINEKMQFAVDFQYSLKGYGTDTENNIDVQEFKYGYFDIIPELDFKLKNYLALGIGVNYGFKVNEHFRYKNEDWSVPVVKIIKSTDFGLTAKIKTNFKRLSCFVRYNIGFKNIFDGFFTDIFGNEIEGAKLLNRNLQFGLGYKLNP